MHEIDPKSEPTIIVNVSLYPYVNNDIEYRLFEDIGDSYYLDSQIKDDSNVTMTVSHNIVTQQQTTTLIHAHMITII